MTTLWASIKKSMGGEAGFSLVEIMVGTAILSGVALTAATMYKNRNQALSQIDHMKDLDKFHKRLSDLLQISSNCNATFRNAINISLPVWSGVYNIDYIRLCTPQGIAPCTEDSLPSAILPANLNIIHTKWQTFPADLRRWIDQNKKTWQIRDISWYPMPNSNIRTGTYPMQIIYELFPGTPKAKRVTKEIPISVKFNGAVFLGCGSESESAVRDILQEFCWSLQGNTAFSTWDNANQRCTLNATLNTCTAGNNQAHMGLGNIGVRTGTWGAPQPGCKTIEAGIRLETLIDPNQVADCNGNLRPYLTVVGGIYRIQCAP